jgi:hypothetical protein
MSFVVFSVGVGVRVFFLMDWKSLFENDPREAKKRIDQLGGTLAVVTADACHFRPITGSGFQTVNDVAAKSFRPFFAWCVANPVPN